MSSPPQPYTPGHSYKLVIAFGPIPLSRNVAHKAEGFQVEIKGEKTAARGSQGQKKLGPFHSFQNVRPPGSIFPSVMPCVVRTHGPGPGNSEKGTALTTGTCCSDKPLIT